MDLKRIFMKNATPTKVGGQAVLDGIMMKGQEQTAVVIRMPDDSMHIKTSKKPEAKKWMKIPVVRGVGVFAGALIEGIKTIMYSADVLEQYEGEGQLEEDRVTLWLNKKFGKEKAWNIMIYASVIFSLAFTVGIFIVLPTIAVNLCKGIWNNDIFLNLVEGFVRIAFFVLYVALVSKMEDIKNVFRYHGAEHKCIHCYENKENLTIENCQKYYTLHPRCGTSFLMFVMIISLILFSFLGWPNVWIRILSRLLLLPIIAGISYELLKWAGSCDNWLVKGLSMPGIWLQKLTTAEPTDKQLEVAIAAMKAATRKDIVFGEGLCDEDGRMIKKARDLIKNGEARLRNSGVDYREAKVQAELLYCYYQNIEKGQLFSHWEKKINYQNMNEYFALVKRRMEGEPLQHIVGDQDFMGLTFKVSKNVLIPRMDTEIIVEMAEEFVRTLGKKQKEPIRVLDLCCGSGAIGISIAKRCENVNVTCADISQEAIKLATENAQNIEAEVTIIRGNLFAEVEGKFDLIVSNPPYIPTEEIAKLDRQVKDFEPFLALDGGRDGLDFYKRIISVAPLYLEKKGILLLEIGHGQGEDITKLFEKTHSFKGVKLVRDLANKERGVFGKL